MDRETLRRIFTEQGFDVNGASPHPWRCEYPDRYGGDCDCVDEMIDAVLTAIETENRISAQVARNNKRLEDRYSGDTEESRKYLKQRGDYLLRLAAAAEVK